MKRLRLLLYISLLLNFLLAITLTVYHFKLKDHDAITEMNQAQSKNDYNTYSYKNFEAVFINKNDSVYHFLWFDQFLNTPEEAYVYSCAYYYTTGETKVLRDIYESRFQLEEIYHHKIDTLPVISSKKVKSKN
jgi:hypothetical protein